MDDLNHIGPDWPVCHREQNQWRYPMRLGAPMWTVTPLKPTLKTILGARIAKQNLGQASFRTGFGLERFHDRKTSLTPSKSRRQKRRADPVRRAADGRRRDAAERAALSVPRIDRGRNRAGGGFGQAQGAVSRRPAVQPGQSAGRHLPDRDRTNKSLLHRAVGARDHTRLLAFRQLRRRSRSIQAGTCTSGRGRLPSTARCCICRATFCAGW